MLVQSQSLASFLASTASVTVLSGAGVSTPSGIPDYRDREGNWKNANPIQYQDFKNSLQSRQRYWARSFVGWQRFSKAQPNTAHLAIAELEATGKVDTLITQNVDGLHAAAGSRRVINLHGNLSRVRCLDCNTANARSDYQQQLEVANTGWHAEVFRYKPDGDAELADHGYRDFSVPDCASCGGTVKPDVVMFGETVPKERVQSATNAVDRAESLLVVGTSLMLFSGFRFARQAEALGKPIIIVNQGRTRADDMATLKVEADCSRILPAALELL